MQIKFIVDVMQSFENANRLISFMESTIWKVGQFSLHLCNALHLCNSSQNLSSEFLFCFGKHMRLFMHCDTLSSSVYEQKQDALWCMKATG